MSATPRSIVVVGAGLAGLRACEGLRARGYEGDVILLGEESHLPYDRPPLSKHFLAGDWPIDRVSLTTPEKLADLGLDARMGPQYRANGLDASTKTISLANGSTVVADGVVLATGAAARHLPDLEGQPLVQVLRTIDDSRALADKLQPGKRMGLIGAGFIGLEVAATARKKGVDVVVIEPLSVPLGRALGPVGGGACESLHREEGVEFRLGSTVDSATTIDNGSRLKCQLSDGTAVEVDALLVGIGAGPSVDWLTGSGIQAGPGGVPVGRDLLAAPGVAAAGDLARWPLVTGELVRVEHRTNAAEQGDWAADGLLRSLGWKGSPDFADLDRNYEVPYVWSDQYDVKIQILGMPGPDDDVEMIEGSVAERRLVLLYSRAGTLTGCVGYSRPRHVMLLRPLLARGASVAEARAMF